jgi:hypothetical protein
VNPIFAAALEIQTFFRARSWRFCFIGGLTVQRWGEPRLTQHVDLTLLTGVGLEGRTSSRYSTVSRGAALTPASSPSDIVSSS